MAETINCALGQRVELNVFCADGAVSIDNNVSEREMKRVVLNRKNSLFVGNPRGGRTAAILASLTSTCRRHEIDPQRYLSQHFYPTQFPLAHPDSPHPASFRGRSLGEISIEEKRGHYHRGTTDRGG